jgi:hypothetical protein
VEVWFPAVKCGDETRAPRKQRNWLHFLVWRRLGPRRQCQERREQKCKKSGRDAQEWACAYEAEQSAAFAADSEPRNRIRSGGLHVRR